jgi:hypothetical protein
MPEEAWLPIVRARAIAMMMDEIRQDLAALDDVLDVIRGLPVYNIQSGNIEPL